MTRIAALAPTLLALFVLSALPIPAAVHAAPVATTEHVSTESTTLVGPQILAAALDTLSNVEIGASEATVTLDVEGESHAIAFDYAELTGGEEGPVKDLRTFAVIGFVGAAGLRLLGFLTRLGK